MTRPALTREEIRKAFDEAVENGRCLSVCTLHTFQPMQTPGITIVRKYKCKECGGVVDRMAYHWYMKGRADAQAAGLIGK